MHINFHFAVGIIFASILNYFFKFSVLEFIFIVFLSFICDLDVFFNKYAKDHNHRLLITHSIIPSIVIIIFGYIFNLPALIFGGFNYAIHIFIDTLDWGTNFLYFQKKQVGFKLLISKDEFENLPKYLAKYKIPSSFFDEKYYSNKICLGAEVIIFILMVFFIVLFAVEYFLMVLLYFPWLFFHLQRHFSLRKIEKNHRE